MESYGISLRKRIDSTERVSLRLSEFAQILAQVEHGLRFLAG